MDIILKGGSRVRLIGDPHLGRQFEAGVPLDRRGERERRQMEKFKTLLEGDGYDYIIVMGDLFDHPYVGYSVVLETYKALVNAAASNKDTRYIVLAGNHDIPRNLEAIGAFHLLEAMCHLRADNLSIVAKTVQVGHVVCFPWKWHIPARDQTVIGTTSVDPVELIVGHWDMHVFGENTDHLAPVKELRKRYGPLVPLWSGHYHIPGPYEIEGEVVHCTGSMEPYSHGEDPEGKIYVTLTPAEIEAKDPEELRDKCVRVLLQEGDEMPVGLDCLALTPKRVTSEQETVIIQQSGFNWNELVERKLGDLPTPVQIFIKERLQSA